MKRLIIFILPLLPIAIGFGGTEEKFIKKYAMMKVYESCFGMQVLKEVRREMKEAAQKCSGFQPEFEDKYLLHEPTEGHTYLLQSTERTPRPVSRPIPSNDRVTRKPIHTADTLLLQQWTEDQKLVDHDHHSQEDSDIQNETDQDTETDSNNLQSTRKPLDLSKLEEAIMNINRPSNHLSLAHRPGSSGGFQTPNNAYYPPMYYPPPMPYPAYPYSPYYPGPGYYQPPAASPYFRSGHRSAKITKGFEGKTPNGRTLVPPKELDVKASIDAMTFHSGAKMRNITCVMQELGYLDEKLEPNYEKMMERISKLHVNEELKKDMLDGVKFCKQFSQCVPEVRKDKYQLSKELLRPMFFFRCYKHKKLESCIMKDVRDRFAASASFEDNNSIASELRRSFQKTDLASTIFEFMYGTATEDFESML